MGATAGAVIVIKERHIVEAFLRAGVTTPDAATTPGSLGISERLAFDILVRDAVLRETRPGFYYLDEPSWNAKRNIRKRMALVALMMVAFALIAIAISSILRLRA